MAPRTKFYTSCVKFWSSCRVVVEPRSLLNANKELQAIGRPPVPVPLWEKQFFSQACGFPWKRRAHCNGSSTPRRTRAFTGGTIRPRRRRSETQRRGFALSTMATVAIFPCRTPNMFIDEVDYGAVIDPELVEDLERPPPDYISDVDDSGTRRDNMLSGLEMLHPNWNDHLLQEIKPTDGRMRRNLCPRISRGKLEMKMLGIVVVWELLEMSDGGVVNWVLLGIMGEVFNVLPGEEMTGILNVAEVM